MVNNNLLLVEKIQVLTLANPQKGEDINLPFLRFLLENGGHFVMSMVPQEIAFAVSKHLSKAENADSRLKIHDLVSQLAVIQKVEIDCIIPGTSVYHATITLTPEGFKRPINYPMIPSNATLLAVLNEAPIYISKSLYNEFSESSKNVNFQIEEEDFR